MRILTLSRWSWQRNRAVDVRRAIKPSACDIDFDAGSNELTSKPLLRAAAEGTLDFSGASAANSQCTASGVTALMVGARYKQGKVVSLLVECRASIAARSKSGCSPLAVASEEGDAAIIEKLLTAGSDPTARDATGSTPLHLAAANGHTQTVSKLIAAVASGAVATGDGCASAGVAALVNTQNEAGETAVMLAAENGQHECVATLIAAGADLSLPKNSGFTPLAGSCYNGFSDVVESLLRSVSSPLLEAADLRGFTPLMLACRTGQHHLVQLLVGAGADIDAPNGEGATALVLSCWAGFEGCVRELLANGASVDAAKNNGFTALMSACYQNHPTVVRMLLEHGAHHTLADDHGYTALHLCCQKGLSALVQQLIRHGADVDRVTGDGNSPLMVACGSSRDRLSIINLLIASHAKLETKRHEDGWTALLLASHAGQAPAVAALLRAGANAGVTASDGSGVLSVCATTARGPIRELLQSKMPL